MTNQQLPISESNVRLPEPHKGGFDIREGYTPMPREEELRKLAKNEFIDHHTL